MKIIRATLSGSFHKDIEALGRLYNELVYNHCQVLSPHRLDFGDSTVLFVRDDAEKDDTIIELERHHLRSIRQSDFLWVHAPNGYIGSSTAMEIGYAIACDIPIFSLESIEDETLRRFIQQKFSVYAAVEQFVS